MPISSSIMPLKFDYQDEREQIETLNPHWQYFMTEDGRYLVYPSSVIEIINRAIERGLDINKDQGAKK